MKMGKPQECGHAAEACSIDNAAACLFFTRGMHNCGRMHVRLVTFCGVDGVERRKDRRGLLRDVVWRQHWQPQWPPDVARNDIGKAEDSQCLQ